MIKRNGQLAQAEAHPPNQRNGPAVAVFAIGSAIFYLSHAERLPREDTGDAVRIYPELIPMPGAQTVAQAAAHLVPFSSELRIGERFDEDASDHAARNKVDVLSGLGIVPV